MRSALKVKIKHVLSTLAEVDPAKWANSKSDWELRIWSNPDAACTALHEISSAAFMGCRTNTTLESLKHSSMILAATTQLIALAGVIAINQAADDFLDATYGDLK